MSRSFDVVLSEESECLSCGQVERITGTHGAESVTVHCAGPCPKGRDKTAGVENYLPPKRRTDKAPTPFRPERMPGRKKGSAGADELR